MFPLINTLFAGHSEAEHTVPVHGVSTSGRGRPGHDPGPAHNHAYPALREARLCGPERALRGLGETGGMPEEPQLDASVLPGQLRPMRRQLRGQ